MLKGPKRSFVVVVFVLGVKSWAKNVTKVTKNVCEQKVLQSEQKMLQSEQKMFANKICSKMLQKEKNVFANENHSICGIVWPSIYFGLVKPIVVLNGVMVFYGLMVLWQFW